MATTTSEKKLLHHYPCAHRAIELEWVVPGAPHPVTWQRCARCGAERYHRASRRLMWSRWLLAPDHAQRVNAAQDREGADRDKQLQVEAGWWFGPVR